MKKIEIHEMARDGRLNEKERDTLNADILWSYCHSRDNGIYEFMISSGFSGLVNALAAFQKEGVFLMGLTETLSANKEFLTNDYKRIPAILMQIR